MPTKLSNEVILAAIEGFQLQKKQIDTQIAELRQELNGYRPESVGETLTPVRRRKKFSAASRRKMALAQKARWAKIKG
jgi:hypothetical protein